MTSWSYILSIFWFLGAFPSLASLDDLNPTSPFERTRLLKDKIVPDLVPIMPNYTLKVTFKKVTVHYGNLVTKHQITRPPDHIYWDAKKDKFYTLVVTGSDDPKIKSKEFLSDAPKNESKAIITPEYIHWLVGNIPARNWQFGEIVEKYQGILRGFHFGVYRLVFYLFEQPKNDMKFEVRLENSTDVEEPYYFSTKVFAKSHNLGYPIALNYCILDFAEKFDLEDEDIPDEHMSDPGEDLLF